jgi:hypothetical protein
MSSRSLPLPEEGEAEEVFLHRAMADPGLVAEFPDTKTRLAIVRGQWFKSRAEDEAEKGHPRSVVGWEQRPRLNIPASSVEWTFPRR